jgi:hypothetical protein
MMNSTYSKLGWPNELSIAFTILALTITLAPYAANADFGIFKVPDLRASLKNKLRWAGPGALILALAGFFPCWPSPPPETGRLELAGLSITDEDAGYNLEFPVLDIQLRNTAREVAFVTSAAIEVTRIVRIPPPRLYDDTVKPSQDYGANIPLHDGPTKVTVPLSQQIKPNNVDRFRIILGSDQIIEDLHNFLVQATVKLHFNSNQTLDCGTITCLFEAPYCMPYDVDDRGWDRFSNESVYHLRYAVQELSKGSQHLNPKLLFLQQKLTTGPATPADWQPLDIDAVTAEQVNGG